MEISRDALLRVIRAARDAKRLADILQNIMSMGCHDTIADRVYGDLADALQMMNRETLDKGTDFGDSRTYTWLFRSSMSDEEVAAEFMRMAGEPKKPALMSLEEFDALVQKLGSNAETPEGEWN